MPKHFRRRQFKRLFRRTQGGKLRFEARELKPYAQPVSTDALQEGEVYFSVNFIDDDMFIPMLEPLVFIGHDLGERDEGRVYFQDVDSHRQGVRFQTADASDHATFHESSKNDIGQIFEYERALDLLMVCALRRQTTPAS